MPDGPGMDPGHSTPEPVPAITRISVVLRGLLGLAGLLQRRRRQRS